jgi:hypothetical protein
MQSWVVEIREYAEAIYLFLGRVIWVQLLAWRFSTRFSSSQDWVMAHGYRRSSSRFCYRALLPKSLKRDIVINSDQGATIFVPSFDPHEACSHIPDLGALQLVYPTTSTNIRTGDPQGKNIKLRGVYPVGCVH